jgi:hypothetical protein
MTEPVEALCIARPGDGSALAREWAAWHEPEHGLARDLEADAAMQRAIDEAGVVPDLPPFPRPRRLQPTFVVALRHQERAQALVHHHQTCDDDRAGLETRRYGPQRAAHDWLAAAPFDAAARDAWLEEHVGPRRRLLAARGLALSDAQEAALAAAWRERCRTPALGACRAVLEEPGSLARWQALAEALARVDHDRAHPSHALDAVVTPAQRETLAAALRAITRSGSDLSGLWAGFTIGGAPAVTAFIRDLQLPDVLAAAFAHVGRRDLRAALPRGKRFPDALRVKVTGAVVFADPIEGARALVERYGGALRVEGGALIIETRA